MSAAPHINYTREFFRPSTPLKEQLQNTSHAYLALLKYIFITSVIFFYKESLTFYPSSDYLAAVQKMKKEKGLMLTLLTCDTSCRAVPPPNMCFSTKFMVGSMVTIIHLCYGLCEPISCSSVWKVRTPPSLFYRLMPENVRNTICHLHLLLLLIGQPHCFF